MAKSAQEKRNKADATHPRKGRPVVIDPGERRRIIFAALDGLFREVGLEGMTMAAIARRAGMSKQTRYSLFQDRDSLFEAFVDEHFAQYENPAEPLDDEAGFADRLRLLFRFDQPDEAWDLPVALVRLAVVEAASHPRLSRRCIEEGRRNKQARIRQELDRAAARGEFKVSDPDEAASRLMDMLHLPILEALVDPGHRPPTEAWQRRFEYGLSVFLNGVR